MSILAGTAFAGVWLILKIIGIVFGIVIVGAIIWLLIELSKAEWP